MSRRLERLKKDVETLARQNAPSPTPSHKTSVPLSVRLISIPEDHTVEPLYTAFNGSGEDLTVEPLYTAFSGSGEDHTVEPLYTALSGSGEKSSRFRGQYSESLKSKERTFLGQENDRCHSESIKFKDKTFMGHEIEHRHSESKLSKIKEQSFKGQGHGSHSKSKEETFLENQNDRRSLKSLPPTAQTSLSHENARLSDVQSSTTKKQKSRRQHSESYKPQVDTFLEQRGDRKSSECIKFRYSERNASLIREDGIGRFDCITTCTMATSTTELDKTTTYYTSCPSCLIKREC